MDDGAGAAKKALAIATGFLVLMGAGCATSFFSRLDLPLPSQQSSTAEVAQPVTVATSSDLVDQTSTSTAFVGNWPSHCFGEVHDIAAFEKDLDAYMVNTNPLPDDFIPTLDDQVQKGWTPVNVCILRISDTEGYSSAIFSLQKTQRITSGDLEGFAKQLPYSNKDKLDSSSFPGSSKWSLVKVGYAGYAPWLIPADYEGEPDFGGTILSPPVAISGTPDHFANVSGPKEIVVNGNEQVEVSITSNAPNDYQETITYYPFSNKLN